MNLLDTMTGVVNASEPVPSLITAGQPGIEQLTAVRDAGVLTVIDLRDPMEPRPFDEAATVRDLGMEYLNIPVNSGALGDSLLDQILGALRQHAAAPVLLHCASANRVGGALIPYFIIDRGMAEDQAVEAAMRVGLRSAEMMEWGLEYARKQQP